MGVFVLHRCRIDRYLPQCQGMTEKKIGGILSFLPAVRRKINTLDPRDPMRLTLQHSLVTAVGRNNAVPLRALVTYLRRRGVDITPTGFQQTILAESRGADFFIGSSRRGYFLIDTLADAREMRDFYERRIRAEQQNLRNLMRQARRVGWNI